MGLGLCAWPFNNPQKMANRYATISKRDTTFEQNAELPLKEKNRGDDDAMRCLLVLDSVTSTPQWTRQPKPRVYL